MRAPRSDQLILALGTGEDRLAGRTVENLEAIGATVWRVSADQLLSEVPVGWRLGGSGWLELGGRRHRLERLTGVLVRAGLAPSAPEVREDVGAADREYIAWEAMSAWSAILCSLSCAVVNRPRPATRGRGSLACEPEVLASAGFAAPAGAMISDPARAAGAFDLAEGQVTAWSPADAEPIALCGQDGRQRLLELTARHPVWVTALPTGDRVRVHVIGDRALAAREDGNEVRLPDALTASCVEIVRSLRLDLAALWVGTSGSAPSLVDVDPWPEPPESLLRASVAALSALLTRR